MPADISLLATSEVVVNFGAGVIQNDKRLAASTNLLVILDAQKVCHDFSSTTPPPRVFHVPSSSFFQDTC